MHWTGYLRRKVNELKEKADICMMSLKDKFIVSRVLSEEEYKWLIT